MTAEPLIVTRRIAASPEQVWAVLTDIDRAAEVLTGVLRSERMSDGPYAVATRWRETRKIFGRQTTEEMWVTATDPARSTVIESSSHGTDYRTRFTLTPDGSGTELTCEFLAVTSDSGPVQQWVMRLMQPMAERATRRAMEQDLADIAAVAEAG